MSQPVVVFRSLSNIEAAIVRGLLDALPEAQAETLALRVILGCSLQEVADAARVERAVIIQRRNSAR